MTNLLVDTICQGCVDIYLAQDSIPRDVLRANPGLLNILTRGQSLPDDETPSQSDATSSTRQCLKAWALAPEPDEGEGIGGPKISVSLWASLGESRNFRMESISGQSRISRVFSFTHPLRNAFDELLLQARSELQNLYPQAVELDWGNTKAVAHESATQYSVIQIDYLGQGVLVQDLFDEFRKERRGPRTVLANNTLEIRLVFPKALLSRELDDDEVDIENSARNPVASKRRRKSTMPPPTASQLSSLRTRHSETALRSQAKALASSKQNQPVVKLRSGFRPPLQVPREFYCRNPPMTSYKFQRTIASFQENGSVTFETEAKVEIIEVADDWQAGREANKKGEAYEATGYVGQGYSKYGIYARFQQKEYVVAQFIDEGLSDDEASSLLRAEYEVLCQCDGFKSKFDAFADESGVRVPAFYFNFKGSILGKLIIDDRVTLRNLQHIHFIATPLLPCGKADSKVKKFTGHDEVGPAKDNITMAM
ncbi:hypothetical protein F5887DRAFT_1079207 [Amanita rubescens]|nr:hypothetical protein F5887DRAFT_1079207 [Amanita rubescens]